MFVALGTSDRHIFIVVTVMYAPSPVLAVVDMGLITSTVYITKPDRTTTCSMSVAHCSCCLRSGTKSAYNSLSVHYVDQRLPYTSTMM